jgi:hypothetical protein
MPHPRTLPPLALLLLSGLACNLIGRPAEAPPPASGAIEPAEVRIERLEVQILESFPVQVNAVVHGSLPDACSLLESVRVTRQGASFQLALLAQRPAQAMCAQVVTPFTEVIPLDVDGLPAGDYLVHANGIQARFTLEVENTLEEAPGRLIEEQGVSFTLPEELAAGAQGAVQPASPAGQDESGFPVWPQHVEFELIDYSTGTHFHAPTLRIYPAKTYRDLDVHVGQMISELESILAARSLPPGGGLPFLPVFNAAQLVRVKAELIDFPSGQGIRFLTQYSQAAYPINNYELFYTFQGLTSDGEYYVSAVLPITHPSLPADHQQIPGGDFAQFAEGYEAYLQEIVQALEGQAPASFIPSLDTLDAFIASLEIH